MAANKVITGVCKVSYAHLVEPYAMEGQEPKSSAVLILPKTDVETRNAIEKAIDKAIEEGAAKFGGKRIAKTSVHIIKDGDGKDDQIYVGCYYINVKPYEMKTIYDRNFLFIELPSKRRLAYPMPRVVMDDYGKDSITYLGETTVKVWGTIDSYLSKFAENVCQAWQGTYCSLV